MFKAPTDVGTTKATRGREGEGLPRFGGGISDGSQD